MYLEWKEWKMNETFSSKYEVHSKIVETEDVFRKKRMKNE